MPVSSSGICGTLLLPLVLLATTAEKKNTIRWYSREVASFTEQPTAFTRAQSAISAELGLRVSALVRSYKVEISIYAQNALENFLIQEANISNTDPVTSLILDSKNYSTAKEECTYEIVKNLLHQSTEVFRIFPVYSSVCNNITGLVLR